MKIATGSHATTLKNLSFLAVLALGVGVSAPAARAGELMDWLAGAGEEDNRIEYPERAPLVVPPSLKLPAPKSSVAGTNPAWPKDPDLERKRRVKEATLATVPTGKMSDPSRPLTPQEMSAGRVAGAAMSGETSNVRRDPSKPLTPLEMQALSDDFARQKQAEAQAATNAAKSRVFLTDPPSVYRQPTKLTPEMEAQAAAAGQPVKGTKPWYQFW